MNPPLFDQLTQPERDQMISLQRALQRSLDNVKINFVYVRICNGVLDKALSRARRLAFYSWAFGRPITSSKELTVWEMFNLVVWLGPHKTGDERSDPWTYSKAFFADLPILIRLFSGAVGQYALQMNMEPAAQPRRMSKRALRKAIKELGFYGNDDD